MCMNKLCIVLIYCQGEKDILKIERNETSALFPLCGSIYQSPRSLLREEDYRFYERAVTSHDYGVVGLLTRGIRNSCYINSTDAPEASDGGCFRRIPHTFFNNPAQHPVRSHRPHKSRIGRHHRGTKRFRRDASGLKIRRYRSTPRSCAALVSR